MRTFNKKNLKHERKSLRNNPTQAEAFLWGYLKNSQLEGRKFRRQSSIKNYIVDFYCPEEKLVIEIDEEGIAVIRFENQEVLLNLDKVLDEIKSQFKIK